MGGNYSSFPIVALPRDRTVLITGGNRGIGYETAKWVAMMGASVIITSRSMEAGYQAIKKMKEEHLLEKKKGRADICDEELSLELMELDLASLTSTMTFIDNFKASGRNLHVLVCNAGIAWHIPELTTDGYEPHFQVNYLGHFLICAHFLPIMKNSGPDCRIILVSSFTHADVTSLDRTKMQGYTNNTFFCRKFNYTLSKLYQVIQCYTMSRYLKNTNVSICSADPGTAATDINRSMQDLMIIKITKLISPIFRWTIKSAFEGAKTIIDCAINPNLTGAMSMYYTNCHAAEPNPLAKQEENQQILLEYTKACLKNCLPSDSYPMISS